MAEGGSQSGTTPQVASSRVTGGSGGPEDFGSSNTPRRPNVTRECSISEPYHLEGAHNYAVWVYRMKHMLQRDGLFVYCTTPPSASMSETERLGRESALAAINNNAKNAALRLLKRYTEPYRCWTKLKNRYEAHNGPRTVMLIEKFFNMRKPENASMDSYLTEVKEVVDLLQEVDIDLPEPIVVYLTVQNLLSQYDIFKRMTLDGEKLPDYEDLESKLIAVEMSLGLNGPERTSEALLMQRGSFRSSGPLDFRARASGIKETSNSMGPIHGDPHTACTSTTCCSLNISHSCTVSDSSCCNSLKS